MEKLDLKKTDRAFYSGKKGRWDRVVVPEMQYLMIDGMGDPGDPDYAAAVGALYPLAYGIKFLCKADGTDFTVPPLSALWWSEDRAAFVEGNRDKWQWTAMIRMPDFVTPAQVEQARAATIAKQSKKGEDTSLLTVVRLGKLNEGESFQTLHIGHYTDEAPVLAELHDRVMPEAGVTFGSPHHEIYLSDPRRVAPEKLKTILRQPVVKL